ncbi:MAG: type I restriction endonuclease subunit R [archaeon]|nr:type I restriction endonuclease subunit R [archaeon]
MATESEAVLEERLIDKLVSNGYERIIITDENDLIDNFKIQLEKLNNTKFTADEFKLILLYLEGGSVYDKAKKLRDKYELQRKDGVKYVSFLNKEEWCKNIFQVTNQITFKGTYTNRYDVTILINGLPLCQIELKKRGVELKKAFNQINRYREHSFHGLFDYVQIFVISNGINTKYYSNNKNLSYKFTFFWKNENNKNINNLSEFADVFLEKCHLSKMISRYVVLHESDKQLMVLRAYQYYAVEAILNKALNTNNNGYVWHTTGSGKTLTSFKVAQILKDQEGIDKVLFVVDRKDLDYQTTKEFNAFCEDSVDGTDNTRSLLKQLTSKDSNLIITTIQKLDIAVKKHKKQLDSIKDSKMILMFDECHRSQFGEMHNNITSYFTNIQFFGFTGTPIFAVNANKTRTTADIFGDRLHTYTIKNAIRDDNVLGFMVEYIGKYKDKTKIDIDVEAIDTKEVMEDERRLSKIVDYIIENHDKKTYNREYTSIFAVSSIEVLNKYYKLFKEKEHDLKIATIYSYTENEEWEEGDLPRDNLENHIKDFNQMFGTNHSTDTFDQYYVDVSKKSKENKIDILLVVNMFLTGFDNKLLNTLYVDKNLQYHGLLQAFSRTNRVLNEKKKQGNIVSFRNIKKDTDNAIQLFSDEEADEYVIIEPYEVYVDKFNEVSKLLDELVPEVQDVDNLPSEEEDKEFIQIFRELLRLMTRLTVFTEFDYKDLVLPEQKFEDYRSKYIDMYQKYVVTAEKTSVVDDIDFEIELVRRDNINVAYIIELLKQLDPNNSSFKKDKEFILKTMEGSIELKSKVELINNFIEQTIVPNDREIDVDLEFDEYMAREKAKEIKKFVEDENLEPVKINYLINNYEFTNKIKNNVIKEALNDDLSFIQKRTKVDEIKEKIIELVEKFTW